MPRVPGVAAGNSGPELFRKLGDELGVRLYVVDPATGDSLFGDDRELPWAAELAAGYAAHGNALPATLPLRLPDAEPGTVCAVAMPGENPTALVVEPIGEQLPSPVLLQHVAVGGALELAQLTAAQERQRRLGADMLARLLDRRIDPQTARAQLAELGLDVAASVLIAAPGPAGPAGNADPASRAAVLHRRLAVGRVSHALLHRDQTMYIMLAESAFGSVLNARLGAVTSVGVSGLIVAAGRVPDAAQEARWVPAVAAASGLKAVRHDDESVTLPPRTPAEARALVSRILAPQLKYDAEQGTDYVGTLRVVLRINRSWHDAAAELHIHKQTLGYRIRKIEQITGRGVTTTAHIAEWWLALRAHDLLSGRNAKLPRSQDPLSLSLGMTYPVVLRVIQPFSHLCRRNGIPVRPLVGRWSGTTWLFTALWNHKAADFHSDTDAVAAPTRGDWSTAEALHLRTSRMRAGGR